MINRYERAKHSNQFLALYNIRVHSDLCLHYENIKSNIMYILPPNNEKFQIKNSYIFHIFAQNIDCGYSLESPRGGSNEYPQSMFLSRNEKMHNPVNPVLLYKSGV